MIVKVENQGHTLVQVTCSYTGIIIGLYLVPETIEIEKFEKEFEKAEDQDEFDNNNKLGVKRITVGKRKINLHHSDIENQIKFLQNKINEMILFKKQQ